jgi:putative hemolysin
MLHLFGRIPSEGEAIEWNNYRFEIADMDSRRIDKVIVSDQTVGK